MKTKLLLRMNSKLKSQKSKIDAAVLTFDFLILNYHNPVTVNVVLLFFALPSSAALSATGCVAP
jgi:hypothetical protein